MGGSIFFMARNDLIALSALLTPCAHATGHGSLDVNKTREYLLQRISSSRPADLNDPGGALDCSWRTLAFEFAPKLLSQRLYGPQIGELEPKHRYPQVR